jgi:hypothetical protein
MSINIEIKKRHLIFILALFLVGTIYATVGHTLSQITADADFDMNSKRITNLGAPSDNGDAANKAYVDSALPAVQYQTTGYRNCKQRDTYCSLPINLAGTATPLVKKPEGATNIYVKCRWGCSSYDSTSYTRFYLGSTLIYQSSKRACLILDDANPQYTSFIEDISDVPVGAELRAQQASDETNYVGECNVVFYK